MAKKEKLLFDLESEKSVLGSMIASRKVCLEALNRLREEDFYDKTANAVIFRAIDNLIKQKREVDNAAVANELQVNLKLLDQVGGVEYLAELQDYYIGDKNASFHIANVYDLSLVRHLFNKTAELEKEFYEKEIGDISMFVQKYEKEVRDITSVHSSGDFKESKEVMDELSKDLQTKRNSKSKSYITGIPSGYKSLDKFTGGWQPGSLNILAARPSVGKTAFAINLIHNAAKLSKKPVAFFSLEMPAIQIARRLLASVSGVNMYDIQNGTVKTDSDWIAIDEGARQISDEEILIDETSGLKIGEIRTKVLKLKAQKPNLGLVVVDYLGLVGVNNPRADQRAKADEISLGLKNLARDANIPIICLCQLSRANEKSGRKPIMSDLRDSGSIEQDADTVILLHREDYQKQDEGEAKVDETPFGKCSMTDIILNKNRNGQTATIKLAFMMNIGLFSDLNKEE